MTYPRFGRLRDGTLVTPHNLPPMNVRWTAMRKAVVVAAVRADMLTVDEACKRYALSADEFAAWEAREEKHGLPGLKATRCRQFPATV